MNKLKRLIIKLRMMWYQENMDILVDAIDCAHVEGDDEGENSRAAKYCKSYDKYKKKYQKCLTALGENVDEEL